MIVFCVGNPDMSSFHRSDESVNFLYEFELASESIKLLDNRIQSDIENICRVLYTERKILRRDKSLFALDIRVSFVNIA